MPVPTGTECPQAPAPRGDAVVMTAAEQRAASRRAGWFWGSIVIGLLGSQIAIGIASAYVAMSDPSVAVVPDYHEKAVRWDKERDSRARSAALNWSVDVDVSSGRDATGRRTIVLSARDAFSAPIAEARATVRLYHHALAAQATTIAMRNQGSGHHTADAVMDRNGLWQFEITVQSPAAGRAAGAQAARARSDVEAAEDQRAGDGNSGDEIAGTAADRGVRTFVDSRTLLVSDSGVRWLAKHDRRDNDDSNETENSNGKAARAGAVR